MNLSALHTLKPWVPKASLNAPSPPLPERRCFHICRPKWSETGQSGRSPLTPAELYCLHCMPAVGCLRRVSHWTPRRIGRQTPKRALPLLAGGGLRHENPCKTILEHHRSAIERLSHQPSATRSAQPAHLEHTPSTCRFLLSTMPSSISAIITCSAVGGEGKRTAISDRDMRSERPEFKSPAPVHQHCHDRRTARCVCMCDAWATKERVVRVVWPKQRPQGEKRKEAGIRRPYTHTHNIHVGGGGGFVVLSFRDGVSRSKPPPRYDDPLTPRHMSGKMGRNGSDGIRRLARSPVLPKSPEARQS